MNDPRRPERYGPPPSGPGPYQPPGSSYPPYTDPAYADQTPYSSTYGGVAQQWAPTPNETKRLPPSWQPEPGQHDETPTDGLAAPPPHGPKSPRWLWVTAAAAVLLVVALVIALVIANGSAKDQTSIEPLPTMPNSTSAAPAPTRTTKPSPSITAVPPPTTGTTGTSPTPAPAGTETVVYNVQGVGRAISIMYMDTGDIMQTEFNVALPWSKQVSLSKSAVRPATVTIVNIGHNVTCSVLVAGVQVSQRTGVGLTVCQGTL